MQENIQQNTIDKWWQQQVFSEQRLKGSDTPERVGEQADHDDDRKGAAGLLAEELRRKDAHIARLEAMLRQAEAGPTEHEPRPEAFLPISAPQLTADPSGAISARSNGAMVYNSPPATPNVAAGDTNGSAAGGANRTGGAMVYETPLTASANARIRLEDMRLEPSPIAQIVMQAAARRLAEPVPAFEPTLRMPSRAAGGGSLRPAQDSPARRRRIAVVGGLGLLAFAGMLGASQLHTPRVEPILIAPPPAIDRAAFTVAPVKVSQPDPVSVMSAAEPKVASVEILPAAPTPRRVRHSGLRVQVAHVAAVPASPFPDPEPLSHPSPAVPMVQNPVHAAHHVLAVHTTQPRVRAAAPAVNILRPAAPAFQAETTGVIVEAGEDRSGVPSSTSRSDTPLPRYGAEAEAPRHSTEVLPDDTRDAYRDSRDSDYRARRRRGYRYSQPDPTETRRNAYRYGENPNRRSDDDADYNRHSTHGYDERNDGGTDGPHDR